MYQHLQTFKPKSARRSSGFSLVELMVAITVGLIILAAVISVFVASVRANQVTLTMAQVHHEVRTVAEILGMELRRSGFWAPDSSLAIEEIDDAAVLNPYQEIEVAANGQCVTYRYNRTADVSDLDPDLRWGFRLVGGEIVTKLEPSSASCANAWGDAIPLTDIRRITITDLFDIDVSGSRCFNLGAGGDEILGTGDEKTTFPCSGVTALDANDGDLLVEHRQITLTVEGQSAGARTQDIRARVRTEIRLPNHRRLIFRDS